MCIGQPCQRGQRLRDVEVSHLATSDRAVAAFNASAGVIFILIDANDTTKRILPEGAVPGLKSEAKATAKPESIILRAGG